MKKIQEWFNFLFINIRVRYYNLQNRRYGRLKKKKRNQKEKLTLLTITFFSILFIFLMIVGTHYWFTTSKGTISVGSNLEKADWLTFWGGFLGFLGTCLLGGLSIWQNYRLDRVNIRLTEQNAISTFHSFLIPQSIIVQNKYLEGHDVWKLDEYSYHAYLQMNLLQNEFPSN